MHIRYNCCGVFEETPICKKRKLAKGGQGGDGMYAYIAYVLWVNP